MNSAFPIMAGQKREARLHAWAGHPRLFVAAMF
jgi:hypothetical protein